VSEGEFKSRERALEYVRLKGGVPQTPPQAPQETPARDAQGKFVSKDETESRAQILWAQAKAIKAATNIDVMEAYRSDPSVRQRILNGADFSEIVPELIGEPKQPPAPMRSPNNAVPPKRGPLELSSEELERLDRNLERGVRVDMRR
jgi:hypothetical protein